MPCQKVGSLTQAPRASVQSWAVALAIASRSVGVRSSRNCCRSAAELRVIGSVAVESIVADRGSPLPQERPDHLLQVGSIDVLLTVLGDLPGLGAIGIGDTVDPLNPYGLEVEDRFGDQHRIGFVWFLFILQHRRGRPCPPLCHLGVWHQGDRRADSDRQQGSIQGSDPIGDGRSGEDVRELRTQGQQFGAPGDQRQADLRGV